MTYAREPANVDMAVEERGILGALQILRARFKERDVFAASDTVKDFLRLQGQGLDHEVFPVMCLDAQNRLINYERLFWAR
jgi:DNA repair protein RadC